MNNLRKKITYFFTYIFLGIITVISLFPWILMLRIALIEPNKYYEMPIDWFAALTFQHFTNVLQGPFLKYLLNSLIIGFLSTMFVMVVGTLAAFALAKYRLRKKDNLLFFVLSTRMGPPVVFAIPLYLLMINLSLIDKHIGMILLYIFYNLAFAIWMMYSFFKDTPVNVEESAMLEGLSDFGVLSRISLPMVVPGLIATSTLVFIFTWNEFFYSLIMTRSEAKTFPAQIPAFFGAFEIDWGGMFSASCLGLIIPLIFGIVVRRYLVRGLTMGTVK